MKLHNPLNRSDWTVEQDWSSYTKEDHAVWQTLFERQSKLLPDLACEAFLEGMSKLPMSKAQVPHFAALSEVLQQQTGWSVVPVAGLIPDEIFFEHLAHRRFPAGRFMRSKEALDYLQEPDAFHDLFGHLPMLMDPIMADFVQAYGKGGLRAQQLGVLPFLARVYWYTVEFGLVQESGCKIYGAGIASSFTESRFAVLSDSPNRIAFNLARIMRTDYRIDDFQESYFVLNGMQALLDLAQIDFAPLYQEAATQSALRPGALGQDDQVLHRGTGNYHAATAA